MIIGVISDTHGLLRPEAFAALQGSEHIIHAGDIGDAAILDRLREIAPLTAIRGNVDRDAWAASLPNTNVLEIGGITIYVIHNLQELDLKPEAAGFAAVIYGHTHIPKSEIKDGVLFFNPGSAGPKRFRLPVTLGKLHVRKAAIASPDRAASLNCGPEPNSPPRHRDTEDKMRSFEFTAFSAGV